MEDIFVILADSLLTGLVVYFWCLVSNKRDKKEKKRQEQIRALWGRD